MLARAIRLRIKVVAHGVGLAITLVRDRAFGIAIAQTEAERRGLGGGGQNVGKIAVRFHGEGLLHIGGQPGRDEKPLAMLVVHNIRAVRLLRVCKDVSCDDRVYQREGRAVRQGDLETVFQSLKRSAILREELEEQRVRAGVMRRGDRLGIASVRAQSGIQRVLRLCDRQLKQAGLQHGDADLLAGLVVTEHSERYRRDLRRGAAPSANVPCVFVDLLLQTPAGVDVSEQMESTADMVGNDIEYAPVRQSELAGVRQTAVDAEVIPCGLGGVGEGGALCDLHRRLPAEDEVRIGACQRAPADLAQVQLADLFGGLYGCLDAAAAVELEVCPVGRFVIIQPAEHTRLYVGIDLKDRGVALRRFEHQPHAAARAHAGVFDALIGAFLTRQTQVHLVAVHNVRAGELNVRARVFQIARSERQMQPPLEHLEIVARRRELEADGRDADKVAVDGGRQPVKAAAAAAQERRGHGRCDGDARLHRKEEVELIRRKPAVIQPLELQICLRFKQIEGVQLQREVVDLAPLEGVDVRLELAKLQTQQRGGIQLAGRIDAVLFELRTLRAIAQLMQREKLIGAAIQDQVQPHLPGEDDIAVRLELRLVNEAADLRDVDEHEHGVVRRLHAERQHPILHRELSGGRIRLLAPIELEARRGVLHHGGGVKAREQPVLIHADVEVVACRPGGGDGGGQGELIVGKFVILALFIGLLLKIAAQGADRIAIERLELFGDHLVGQRGDDHAAARLVKPQLAGVLRDGDLVRVGELGIFHLPLILTVYVAEAPDVHHSHIWRSTCPDRSAAGLGGEAVRLCVVRHEARGV